jgi:ribosomal protein S18 acetylase RimI-like enzyme
MSETPQAKKIAVRIASIHDVETVSALFAAYRRFYEQPADIGQAREFLRERFAHRESVILLAGDAIDDALGFTQLYPLFSSVRCTRKYLLNDLFVTPAARRHGIAKRLLESAAEFARAAGAAALSLSTATTNYPAQKLYASLGWQRDTTFFEYNLELR